MDETLALEVELDGIAEGRVRSRGVADSIRQLLQRRHCSPELPSQKSFASGGS
jgi:hypothetical protein